MVAGFTAGLVTRELQIFLRFLQIFAGLFKNLKSSRKQVGSGHRSSSPSRRRFRLLLSVAIRNEWRKKERSNTAGVGGERGGGVESVETADDKSRRKTTIKFIFRRVGDIRGEGKSNQNQSNQKRSQAQLHDALAQRTRAAHSPRLPLQRAPPRPPPRGLCRGRAPRKRA